MKKLILLALLIPSLAIAKDDTKPTCGAKTKKGTECQIKVEKIGDKCKYHNPNTPRCTFIKKDGIRCKVAINEQQDFCHFHNNQKSK